MAAAGWEGRGRAHRELRRAQESQIKLLNCKVRITAYRRESSLDSKLVCFQPLFPGSNELDQISKIYDIIGTSANKTLSKFKQQFRGADVQALATHKKLRLLGDTAAQVPLYLWQI